MKVVMILIYLTLGGDKAVVEEHDAESMGDCLNEITQFKRDMPLIIDAEKRMIGAACGYKVQEKLV